MNEQIFRKHVHSLGYSDLEIFQLEPAKPTALHAHEFSSIGLVIRGSVTLAFENTSIVNMPGEFCEIAAGVLHEERPGPEGVIVLLASKQPDV